jgi:hypothetical protein
MRKHTTNQKIDAPISSKVHSEELCSDVVIILILPVMDVKWYIYWMRWYKKKQHPVGGLPRCKSSNEPQSKC